MKWLWQRNDDENDDDNNNNDGQFSYLSDATQEMRKVLLDDHDRIWQAYKYEHILNTTCRKW